jgi:YVTN family beta-propeller protein
VVAISPDGAFAYVTISSSNTVQVIATATNTVVATIPVGGYPYGLAIQPFEPKSRISPTIGGNAGYVSLDILGQGFSANPTTVVLRAAPQPDIVGIAPAVISSSEIIDTFNLQGAIPGLRNVVVDQTGAPEVVYPGAFTIQAGGQAELAIDVVGPSLARAGREAIFDVVVSNTGTIDAPSVSVGATTTAAASSVALPECSIPTTNVYMAAGSVQQFQLSCTPHSCYDIMATMMKMLLGDKCALLALDVKKSAR